MKKCASSSSKSIPKRTITNLYDAFGKDSSLIKDFGFSCIARYEGPIDLVYGGFHMLPFDRAQTGQLVGQLKNDLGVRRVAPAHCTGHLAFKLLQEAYGGDYLYAGLGERIGF